MIRRAPSLLLVLLVLAVQACGRGRAPVEPVIDRDRFVAVNIALRQIDRGDEGADSLRNAVLEEYAVTQDELHAFVRTRGDRPAELAAIWSEIHERLIAIQLEEDARPVPGDDVEGAEPGADGELPGEPTPEPAGIRPGPLRVDLEATPGEASADEASDDEAAERPEPGRPALRAPVPRRPAPVQ